MDRSLSAIAQLAAVMGGRHACPVDKGAIKGRAVGVAQIQGDLGDGVPGLAQAGQRHVPAQCVLDGAKA